MTAVDISPQRLAEVDDLFGGRVATLFSNPQNIEEAVAASDLAIGAVLIPGAKAPKLVTKEVVSEMEKGSVVVDIAVDQGGCFETCRPTDHEHPTFTAFGVIHYCVTNIPGAVAQTSTYALTNATLKYACLIADLGLSAAIGRSQALRKGVNIFRGELVYKQVADDLGLPYSQLPF